MKNNTYRACDTKSSSILRRDDASYPVFQRKKALMFLQRKAISHTREIIANHASGGGRAGLIALPKPDRGQRIRLPQELREYFADDPFCLAAHPVNPVVPIHPSH